MRKLLAVLLLQSTWCFGQVNYSEFTDIISELWTKDTESVFQSLVDTKRIPLVVNDSVAFLYKTEASTVSWMGDFNGWGYYKEIPNQGKRIPNSDIWILKNEISYGCSVGLQNRCQ